MVAQVPVKLKINIIVLVVYLVIHLYVKNVILDANNVLVQLNLIVQNVILLKVIKILHF